jgi:hypothetical protein
MKINKKRKYLFFGIPVLFLIVLFLFGIGYMGNAEISFDSASKVITEKIIEKDSPKDPVAPTVPPLDKEAYDAKVLALANNPAPVIPKPIIKKVKDPKTGKITEVSTPAPAVAQKPNIWPVKTVYPNDGAILPFKRVVAYYGNLYSKQMGILGEYTPDVVLEKLTAQVKEWEIADPETPVQPALHYIAVVAQGSAGKDGKYRFRMPDSEIEKVIEMAKKIDAIVFLDIQVGLSNINAELPTLEKYLKLPNVHLGIDPEFYMRDGKKPGKYMGTMDASEINFAIDYLSKIVKENNLTPKILVIHRFTQKMVTNYKEVKILPEVQFVMNMDGWGGKAKKIGTYNQFVYKEPIQFTGFKIFYKTDVKEKGTVIFKPEELLKLNPRPIYIQYQ